MATAVERQAYIEVSEQLRDDTPFYAENFLKILPKTRKRGLIPFVFNNAQTVIDSKVEAQRTAGRPQRVVNLKARQIGGSTWAQGKGIQRSTLWSHHNALVVAHDVETGGKLYAIGQRMYRNLPEDEELLLNGETRPLRPDIRSYKRSRFLHFGQAGHIGLVGDIWPDSTYFVDTAGEFEAGRGGTYHFIHGSEVGFWPQAEQKYIALMNAVPDDEDTLVCLESTANGHNFFKDVWDDAWNGRSGFVPFFWPWWKQEEYTRPFVNEAEREEFLVGDTDQSPYAEEEVELIKPGPLDTETGECVPLTLEQLNWRRWCIADKCGGKIDKFHAEYPSTPEQAFLATGRKVFEPIFVSRAMIQAEKTDPRVGKGGPLRGAVVARSHEMQEGRFGEVRVPLHPTFVPARELDFGQESDWRFWLPSKDGHPIIPKDRPYVVGGDVSEGLTESEDETADPAYHALQVIDHISRVQVAEYRSRCDPDELAEHALLIAVMFNEAWLAIERTGPGRAVVRKLRHDFHYPFMYRLRRHATQSEKEGAEFGWDTNRKTKPILLAGIAQLLREETHGIKSRRLVAEMQTYIRLSTGKTVPEKGKFADLLMAWGIAQQVAEELPPREVDEGTEEVEEEAELVTTWQPRDRRTGY